METLSKEAMHGLMLALDLNERLHVQEALNSLLLSECAYKLSPHEQQHPVEAAQRLASNLPRGFVSLQSIQCSRETALHRYQELQPVARKHGKVLLTSC